MKYLAYIFLSILIVSCANPVSPTGGPKDITPPIIETYDIDTFPKEKKITITFNELIKTTNAIHLNPQTKKPFKPNISSTHKGISFTIPNYTSSINLQNSISDINEGNAGKYSIRYFNTDTFHITITPQLPEYFKSQKDLLQIETKIDTLYYRSTRIKDTISITGFPANTKQSLYYIDNNKNNTYDSSEWSIYKDIDSNQTIKLFPPINNKIEIDTNYNDNIVVIPFYLQTAFNQGIHYIRRINDTLTMDKNNTEALLLKNSTYVINYKKFNLKNYYIQDKIITDKDTTHTIRPSILEGLNPSVKRCDTLYRTTKMGVVIFENVDSLNNIEIILLKDKKYYKNFSLTLTSQSITLEQGEYILISYIDNNKDLVLNQNKPSDDILQFFETFLVKPTIDNVIKIGKTVKNEPVRGGKTDSEVPTSIKLKRGVNQPNLIRE